MCLQMMLVWLYILLEQTVRNLYLKWNYDTNLLDLEGLLDLYINILLKIAGASQSLQSTDFHAIVIS